MDSNLVSISVNLKIKGNETTLSIKEVRELYLQLKAVLGYAEPYSFPYPWGGYPNPYISYTITSSGTTDSNWKTS